MVKVYFYGIFGKSDEKKLQAIHFFKGLKILLFKTIRDYNFHSFLSLVNISFDRS